MPQVRDARDIINSHSTATRSSEDANYVCTVVNLIPIDIDEQRPHMFPSSFMIPGAEKDGEMGLFYVGEGIHYIPDPFEERSFKQVTSPHEMARSLCDDYTSAHIGISDDAKPGLFWVPGRCTEQEIRTKYAKQLAAATELQRNWYRNLVALADVDWEKSKNRLAVSDLQRIGAKALGIQKEWVEFRNLETVSCPYCNIAVQPGAIKCHNCKEVIDVEAYNRLTAKVNKPAEGTRLSIGG